MNHPEDIVESIIGDLTTDTFTFVRGTKPEQNFDVDEIDFSTSNGAALMDNIGKVKWNYTITNYREAYPPISLFFAYKTELDNPTDDQLDPYVKRARLAADEFVLRLKAHEAIKTVADVNTIEVYNLFDLNLSGVLLECTPTIKNTDSSCLA